MMRPDECVELFERYILGKASDDEIIRLNNWIRSNPAFSGWFETQLKTTPSEMDAALQYKILQKINNEIETEERHNNSFAWIRKWYKVAVVILLPLLGAFGMYLFLSSRISSSQSPYTIAVDNGQRANVTLPDGTKVWLNSQSKLTCVAGFNQKNRELQLAGEAYFEVAHNPQKPFRVLCDGMSVEALGTAFVVRAYKEDKTVSSVLIQGKVRVGTSDGQTLLKPNDRIEYDKNAGKQIVTHVTNASDFTGWRNNELRFENESLQEIAKSIERTYNVKMVFASNDLAKLRFTGTLNSSSLQSVLNILALTSSANFRIDHNQVILSKK